MTTSNWILIMWVGVQWIMCACAASANLSNLMYGLLALVLADILTSSLEKISWLITSLVSFFAWDSLFFLLALSLHCYGWKGGPQYNEDCTCQSSRNPVRLCSVFEIYLQWYSHAWQTLWRSLLTGVYSLKLKKNIITSANAGRYGASLRGEVWCAQ